MEGLTGKARKQAVFEEVRALGREASTNAGMVEGAAELLRRCSVPRHRQGGVL